MLAARFEDLRDQLAFRIQIRKTATKAVAYPIFILCFAGCVIGLRWSNSCRTSNCFSIPSTCPCLHYRLVLGVSVFVQSHWPLILIAAGAGLAAFRLCRIAPISGTLIDRLSCACRWSAGFSKRS